MPYHPNKQLKERKEAPEPAAVRPSEFSQPYQPPVVQTPYIYPDSRHSTSPPNLHPNLTPTFRPPYERRRDRVAGALGLGVITLIAAWVGSGVGYAATGGTPGGAQVGAAVGFGLGVLPLIKYIEKWDKGGLP